MHRRAAVATPTASSSSLRRVQRRAHGDARLILDGYSAFSCILHHRLAHALLTAHTQDKVELRQRTARWLADQGKVISGADIHPAAKIGRRFRTGP